jgi:signal transduction histidine kinase
MDVQNTLLIMVFIANIFLSIFVFFHKNKEDKLNSIFALLALNVSLWVGSMFFFRQFTEPNKVFIALKTLYVVPIFIPVIFFYFVLVFTKTKLIFSERSTKLILFLISSIVSLAVVLTGKFIVGVSVPEYGEKIIKFGSLYWLYILHFMLFFGLAFVLLTKSYFLSTNSTLKTRTGYLLLGTFLSSSLGMITNLIFPWIGFFELNWLGNVLTIFFSGFITYAIIRYKLLNIKVVTAEALSFVLIIVLLIETFFAQSVLELLAKTSILILITILSFLLIHGIYKEIEERNRVEKLALELDDANKKLRQLEKQKTEFVSIASHQLRTPLTAIKGYASMLLEGSFGELSVGVSSAVDKIYKSSQMLVVIIQDFLMVSRIEQRRVKYDFNTVEIRKLVREAVDEAMPDAEEKGLEIELQIDDTGVFSVNVDYEKMKQVFRNIINNAVRYTDHGFIKVVLSMNKENGKIRVTVSDTGIGIDKKTNSRLFKKFSRGEKDSRLGSGLGLFVAKEIVKAHKGRIWAESEGLGHGSTFFVELPESRI